jgi:NAD(P)-dependent dehydrogenase (short-subunit alcohol dehydrogenase family)
MILITGASKGIGRYLYDSYSNMGRERVVGTFNQSRTDNDDPNMFHLDVTDYSQVSSLVESLITGEDEVTLINCAGITYSAFAHKSDIDSWKRVVEVNLFGTFNLIRAVLPSMRAKKYGRIINMSSVVAVKPTPGVSSYAASKAALWGLTRSIAVENAILGITVNCLNLGYTELGMIEQVPTEFKEKIMTGIPVGTLCPKEDILQAVDFLRETSYITGQNIDLNGGLT